MLEEIIRLTVYQCYFGFLVIHCESKKQAPYFINKAIIENLITCRKCDVVHVLVRRELELHHKAVYRHVRNVKGFSTSRVIEGSIIFVLVSFWLITLQK